jgi:flagellar basal-body rod protein FlgG
MAIRALYSAATGMQVNEFNLDTIANNLANAGTTAYKKTRTNFEDLYYQYVKPPGGVDANSLPAPIGIGTGLGARVSGTQLDFNQGNMLETGRHLDVAISGNGFFQIQDTNTGNLLYARAGNFTINSQNQMVLASADQGRLLSPGITIPQGATNIAISGTGQVSANTPPSTLVQQIGTLQLTTFINPEGLLQVGENLYAETTASGTALQANPGQNGAGLLRQGFLEASNVEPVRELVDLIRTQRNFEMNSQVVQASDQLLQLVANLRRF